MHVFMMGGFFLGWEEIADRKDCMSYRSHAMHMFMMSGFFLGVFEGWKK